MSETALSDEADALYEPLGNFEPWMETVVPEVAVLPGDDDPAWTAMVRQGTLLAAAHESGALDGVHDGDRCRAMSLLTGLSSLADVGEPVRAHALANYEALRMAVAASPGDLASEAWIRRVHEVACRPQRTHRVRTEGGVQDHVLAAGDYKHHPNHVRLPSGGWIARSPVGRLGDEMHRFLDVAGSHAFATAPAAVRAAYAHHALTHIAPFEDGNGRVARVLATAHLLPAGALPFVVFADESPAYAGAMGDPGALIAYIQERSQAVADLLAEARSSADSVAALNRWRDRAEAGEVLAALLPPMVEHTLERHRQRPDLGFLSPLTDVVVVGTGPTALRAATVEERLSVDAHPALDAGLIVLRAQEAQLRLDVAPEDVVPEVSHGLRTRLAEWVARAVSSLALRVAADEE